MPTITQTVCATCGRKSCDGGLWKVVKVVSIKDGTDVSFNPDHFYCTLGFKLRSRDLRKIREEHQGVPVGVRVVKEYDNWVPPSRVTLEKYEM